MELPKESFRDASGHNAGASWCCWSGGGLSSAFLPLPLPNAALLERGRLVTLGAGRQDAGGIMDAVAEFRRIVPRRYVFSRLRLIMRHRPTTKRGVAEELDAPRTPGKRRERRAASGDEISADPADLAAMLESPCIVMYFKDSAFNARGVAESRILT